VVAQHLAQAAPCATRVLRTAHGIQQLHHLPLTVISTLSPTSPANGSIRCARPRDRVAHRAQPRKGRIHFRAPRSAIGPSESGSKIPQDPVCAAGLRVVNTWHARKGGGQRCAHAGPMAIPSHPLDTPPAAPCRERPSTPAAESALLEGERAARLRRRLACADDALDHKALHVSTS
jgi:hypothetical protein